ncbi:hypothetical protein MJM99_33860, partial [Salmonella enterica subsp. enterica serovar Kentucky]|nr:hypothetical protein [Salmonella enterica subsp. enterica serovar Kentucky]
SVQQAAKRWSGFSTLARRAPYFSSILIGLVGVYMGIHGYTGIKVNGASYNLDADMIAPFSSQTWWLPGKRSLKSFSGTVTVTLV